MGGNSAASISHAVIVAKITATNPIAMAGK
jgi:hypothetical protein